MELITMAGAFASIVGLICNFKSERNATDRPDTQEFLNWLDSLEHHNQIKDLIESNQEVISGIEKILREDTVVLLEKLNQIDNALASYATRVDTFNGLSAAIKPNATISQQAINILKRIEEKGASGFIKSETYDGSLLTIIEGGEIEYDEPRFIEDDLSNLVDLNLLRRRKSQSGSEVFKITRNASGYLDLIKV
jgi:hypothetical protein